MADSVQDDLARAERWLKSNTKRNAFKKLEKEIVKTGVCTECGACVSNCPVDALTGVYTTGKYVPTLTGNCTSCGICYTVCPRTLVFWKDLVGDFRSAWKVRSKLQNEKRQDGGAVIAFLSYMLDKKIVEAAVVTRQDTKKPWMPVAVLAVKKEELMVAGGSIYTHSPVVQEMMRGFKSGLKTIAVVGTSCNIDAISKMETHPAGLLQIDLGLGAFKIGLFCMESFTYTGLVQFLEKAGVDLKEVQRMAISSGVFTVTTSQGKHEWPVEDLSRATASSCSYCRDFSCKNADLSCGNIGSDEGWTTVLVRTIRGEQILQESAADGYIEAELLDPKGLESIERVARSKAMRYYSLKPER
ncbi:MAG: NADP oxidoreductase [Candidatus Thorarchaeota archaeon]|nr:MAG: NADP oxidoreductase [Candidatus Thorarchaeota archaeon]